MGAAVLLTAAAWAQTPRPLSKKAAANILYAKKSPAASQWQLTDIYDPYNGGTHNTPTPPIFLKFSAKGTYSEGAAGKESTGKWLISADTSSIAMFAPSENPSFDRQLRTHTSDSLVLARQGRHGMVIYTYVRYKSPKK